MERAASPLAVGEPEGAARAGQPPPVRRRLPRVWVIAVVVACALVLLAFRQFSGGGPAPITRGDVDRAVKSGIEKAERDRRNAPPDAATAYRTILPSLVTITAEGATTSRTAGTGRSSLGSGVVINTSGAVLTALHVVEDGVRIRVRFSDGTEGTATVTARQAENDIAVLTVDRLPEVIVPAVMGGAPQVGDAVFPVGNPLGLQASLTAGVVSALDRSIRTPDGRTLERLIQFDAAVNPGNSGGPLLNRDGQVIGIVTGLANPSAQSYFVGIGFAVPIAIAGGAAGGPPQ